MTPAEAEVLTQLGVEAIVKVPIARSGRPPAGIFVHHTDARPWSDAELALIEAVADQTWLTVERARAEAAVRYERMRAQLALDAAAMGSFVWYANEDLAVGDARMRALFDLGEREPLSLAQALAHMIHVDDRARYAAAVARAIDPAGPGELNEEIRVRWRDGTERWLAIRGRTSFAGDPPQALTIAGAAVDLTDQKHAQAAREAQEARERRDYARGALLSELVVELDALEGVQSRLTHLVASLVPDIAAHARIEQRDEDGRLRRLVERGTPPPASPAEAAVNEVAMPLIVRGRQLATLVVGIRASTQQLRDEQLAFISQVIAHVEVSLAAAQLREQEHAIAVGLQRALLPERLIAHPEAPLAARYMAGGDGLEVGGDWYDSFVLPAGRLGLCVGDVVGHGLGAAAAMGRLRVALATLAAGEDDLGRVLAQLDAFAAGPNGARFVTVCYAVFDPATRLLRYASAGHPPMLVVGPDQSVRWLDAGRSAPLFGAPRIERPTASTTLEPGALLIMYSDGLIERRGETIDRGLERLAAVAGRLHGADVESACAALVDQLSDHGPRRDDVVVLCLRVPPVSGGVRPARQDAAGAADR